MSGEHYLTPNLTTTQGVIITCGKEGVKIFEGDASGSVRYVLIRDLCLIRCVHAVHDAY